MKGLWRILRSSRFVTRRRLRVAAGVALVAVLGPCFALLVASLVVPMPGELADHRAPGVSVVISDRDGVVFREVKADDGERARWVSIDEVGPDVPRALVAAEDRRFYSHAGVDPWAVIRAFGQMIATGRVVSGASTLTQQLARNVVSRPRTFRGKFLEMALALKIERSLSKRQILEQYLNRVEFGPGVRGIQAASQAYFDKPARDLSLAEAAALASIPRGPVLYDPKRGTERVQRRRDRVLDRLGAAGLATADEVARAKSEPIAIARGGVALGAPHLVRAVMNGSADELAGAMRGRAASLSLTIDRELEREVETLARETVRGLKKKHVSAASVIVLENATGEVLAYVGSPDVTDAEGLGYNDGVMARRQPGSSLKPFVYELAMERLGFTAATALPDVDLYLPTRDGDYHPNNYDGRFHGPVRLREALANSFNVPAVWTASALGAAPILDRLEKLGFQRLDPDAEHYGAAIALGDAEVRLVDLANAYATLARGGVWMPVRAVRSASDREGRPVALGAGDRRTLLDPGAVSVITDILADKNARLASFGENSALELPFPAAAKTGTSKGYRDNIAVGFTPRVTVAVWVGNFDGSPMEGVSGVTGAGPLFHDAMVAAARRFPAGDFVRPADRIEEAEICSLSGERPEHACAHRRTELFAKIDGRSSVPTASCTMHEEVSIDPRNGLRAGPGCAVAEKKTFEVFDAELASWAKSAGRSLAPEKFSPLCPGDRDGARGRGKVRVAFPPDGSSFVIDPSATSKQALSIRADVPAGARAVRFVIDGRTSTVSAPYAMSWPLSPGSHRVLVEADGEASELVEFAVE